MPGWPASRTNRPFTRFLTGRWQGAKGAPRTTRDHPSRQSPRGGRGDLTGVVCRPANRHGRCPASPTARTRRCGRGNRCWRRVRCVWATVHDPLESHGSAFASLLLQRLQVSDERVDLCARSLLNHLGTVAGLRGPVAVSPYWHLTRSMRGNRRAPVDHFLHFLAWEPSATCLADLRQVGGTRFERLCQRPITPPVDAVARHAGKLVFGDAQMLVLCSRHAGCCTRQCERQDQQQPCRNFSLADHSCNFPRSPCFTK